MTRTPIDKQKRTIKSKFRTLQRFINLTGLDPKKAQSYFAGRMAQDHVDEFHKVVHDLIKSTHPDQDPFIIDDTTRMTMWRMIKWHYRTIRSFSTEHPEFPPSYLSRVLGGQKIRRDDRFNDLLQVTMSLGKAKVRQNPTRSSTKTPTKLQPK
jgi:hypothetical protein